MSYCLKREKEPLLDNESEPGSEDRYQELLLAGSLRDLGNTTTKVL